MRETLREWELGLIRPIVYGLEAMLVSEKSRVSQAL